MQNMNEIEDSNTQRVLAAGFGGGGKTTQFLTLPGKKFAYLFDPNSKSSLIGHDIDFEEFNPDINDIDIAVKTLKSDVGDKGRAVEPKTYNSWEKDFESKLDEDFFAPYDWIGFDSFTMFLAIIMDRLLYLNKRPGKQPEQADWAAQVNVVTNVFRVLSGLGKNLYATCHIDMRQNDVSKKVYNHLLLTGALRTRTPLLFNHVLCFMGNSDEEHIQYIAQTRSDRENPWIRTSMKGLEYLEDITIPFPDGFKDPEQYGLGALFKKAGATIPLVGGSTAKSTSRKRK
jgi:hypothetical protein